jgi:hypothetical protein
MYNSLEDFVGDFNMNVVGLQILCKISFRCSTRHLIEELPYKIENLEARQDLEKNASNIIGEKPNEGIRCPALCCKISNVYYHKT